MAGVLMELTLGCGLGVFLATQTQNSSYKLLFVVKNANCTDWLFLLFPGSIPTSSKALLWKWVMER